jgi:hypothetical protein
MANDKDQLLDDMKVEHENWNLRSILADWYEDNKNFDAADAVRWAMLRQKRPYSSKEVFEDLYLPKGEPNPNPTSTGAWFNADTVGEGLGDSASDLPGAVYERLTGSNIANHHYYPTVKEAEEDFVKAWILARNQGWDPESVPVPPEAAKEKND